MKYKYLIILIFNFINANAFLNINRCNKKFRVGLKYAKSRIQKFNSTLMRKYEDDIENKSDFIESTINESSIDVVEELSELFSIATNTNKEFLYVFQQIISQYLQINISQKIDEIKKPINVRKIVIKNIIIPTIIHDTFQLIINSFIFFK